MSRLRGQKQKVASIKPSISPDASLYPPSARVYEGGSLFVISGLCSAERMGCNKGHCKWFVKNSRWKSLRRSYYLGQLALSRSEVNEAQHSKFLASKRATFLKPILASIFGLGAFIFLWLKPKTTSNLKPKTASNLRPFLASKPGSFVIFSGELVQTLSKMPSLPGCCGISQGKVCLSTGRPNCGGLGGATRKVAWHSARVYEGGSLSGLCSAERMGCKWFVKNSRWKSFRRSYYLGQLALSRSEVNEAHHSKFLASKRATFLKPILTSIFGLGAFIF